MGNGELTLEESNKIIAEYMGTTIEIIESINYAAPTTYDKIITKGYKYTSKWYSESLDALVPVREKLAISFGGIPHYTMIINRPENNITYKAFIEWVGKDAELLDGNFDTPQEAACLATAKAIKELND